MAEDLHPHTPAGLETRDAPLKQGRLDDAMFRFSHQFAAADKIVIAAPYWDLSFPAILKTYIEGLCDFFFDIPQRHFASAEGLDIAGANVQAILAAAQSKLEKYALEF